MSPEETGRGPEAGGDAGDGGGGGGKGSGSTLLAGVKWLVRVAVGVLVVVAVLGAVITVTGPGQRWALDVGLGFARDALRGTVTVDGISSTNLVDGLTLYGVAVDGPGGEPFLRVDTLSATYSPLGFLGGDVVLNSLTLRGLTTRISIPPGETRTNAEIVLGLGAEPDTSSAPPRRILFQFVNIVRGEVEVLLPLEEGEEAGRAVTTRGPDGRRLQRIEVTGLEATVSRLLLSSPEVQGIEATLDDATLRARLFEGPDELVVERLRGLARVRNDSVQVAARELRLPGSRLQGDLTAAFGGGEGVVFDLELEADPLEMEAVQWAEPRLPAGAAEGRVGLTLGGGRLALDFGDARLRLQSARAGPARAGVARADGAVALGSGDLEFSELDVEMEEVPLDVLRPWVPDSIPARGALTGRLSMDGPARAVAVDGRVSLLDPDAPDSLSVPTDTRIASLEPILPGDSVGARTDTLADSGPAADSAWAPGQEAPGAGAAPDSAAARDSVPPARPTPPGLLATLEARGTVRMDRDPGASGLVAVLEPFDYRLLRPWLPDSLALRGDGRIEVEATGRLSDGMRFDARVVHRDEGLPTSRMRVQGSARLPREDVPVLDVQGDVSPLSLAAVRRYVPGVEVDGEVSGMFRARGPVDDLRVNTTLTTPDGRLELEGRVDALDPARAYQARGTFADVPLGRFVPRLPDDARVDGYLEVEGSGFSPDSARARGRVALGSSRLGGVRVDTVGVELRLDAGEVSMDTILARVGGIRLQGGGRIPVRPREEEGVVRFSVQADSVGGLRSLIFPDTLFQDELSDLERERLIMEGIDPETLPTRAEVALEGSLDGEGTVRGSLEEFRAQVELAVGSLRVGENRGERIDLELDATRLPSLEGRIRLSAAADSLSLLDRAFTRGELEVDYTDPEGRVTVALARADDEDYRARARVQVDSLGGRVALEALTLRFDTLRWELEQPSTVSWDDQALRFEELVVRRPESDALRIRADGVLPREGPADFELDVEGLSLQRITRVAQLDEMGLQGLVDLAVQVQGTAAEPRIHGELAARGVAYETWEAERVEGTLDYQDREVTLDLGAWREEERVLTATGSVPANLALTPGVEDRTPDDREMDLALQADSLPAAFIMPLIEALEDVEGTLSADFDVRGTFAELEPSGTVELRDAAWSFPALGVRHTDIRASLALDPQGTVEVDASARAAGTVEVTGTVDAREIANPVFDLVLTFDGFQAINRRDMTGRVSGEVTLEDEYRSPVVRGLEAQGRGLRVDEGVLYVEEFQRSTTVVDLSDPRFFDRVDSELLGGQPILAESQNPFLQRLRVEVDLGVDNNTWLRSSNMNVEIGGDLVVTYDRRERDLVLSGTLQAIRGQYSVLGRRFEVEGGTVEFVGTPGVNPNLDIQAQTRIRRAEEPLEILATVSGTLAEPRVRLSNEEEQNLAESDLVSYLVFGRSSSELTSGQAQAVGDAFEGAALTTGLGTLSNQLGNLVARGIGVDYFAINQGAYGGSASGAAAIYQATLEFGKYWGDDFFWVLTVRPQDFDRNTFGGRLEWQATDAYTVEIFVDDRFFRSGGVGFQELGFQAARVFGVNLFREWTY